MGSVKKASRVPYYRGSCAGEKVYGEAGGECCAVPGVAEPQTCKCHLIYHAVIAGFVVFLLGLAIIAVSMLS